MSWHVDQEVLHRYQEGTVDRVTAASLETHVTECQFCRGLLTVDDEWLEQSWTAVANRVEPSRPSLVERSLKAVGIPENVAPLVAVSPALRISFVLAVALVTVFAAVASTSNPDGESFRIFLVVAPLLPVVGVAFAYGRLVDPAHELTIVAPIDSFRLLMLRAATVLTVSIGLGLIAWPVVPAPVSFGLSAWLFPALALTLTTLAVASRFETWLAGAMVGGGWVAVMLLAYTREIETFDAQAQIVYAGLIGLAAVVVALRRNSYDREGGNR